MPKLLAPPWTTKFVFSKECDAAYDAQCYLECPEEVRVLLITGGYHCPIRLDNFKSKNTIKAKAKLRGSMSEPC